MADSSEVNDDTCEDQLSKCEIKRMEKEFYKFRNGSLEFINDSWDSPKEEKYWKSRFEEEYMKLGDESEDRDLLLVADIAQYIDWVTHEMLLESDKYPDKYNCIGFICPERKVNRRTAIFCHLIEEMKDAKHDDDFDEWSREDKTYMNSKFMDYVKEYFYKDLRKDNSYKVEFEDDLKEVEYWVARFNKEIEKIDKFEDSRREYLAAYMFDYLQKFASDKQLEDLTDPLDEDFLDYLNIWD